MAAAYRVWAGLVSLAIVVQVGFAGVGAFHAVKKVDDNAPVKTVDDWFGPHTAFGYIIGLLIIVLLILAFASRRRAEPRDARVKWAAILLGLWVLQVLLAWFGQAGNGAVGFLHPVNALLIAGIAGVNAQRAWSRAPAPATAAPVP